MRTIKLLIAYDGTDFCGWQRQDAGIAKDLTQGREDAEAQGKIGRESAAYAKCVPSPSISLRVRSWGIPRTVQGVIEDALETMHRHPVALSGAGRTDSGVHAAGQCAHFHTDIESIDPPRFVPALNGLLPPDVRILESVEAAPDFHARFDARMRTYRYFFIGRHRGGRQALPHESRYALQLWRSPRVDLLNAYCRLLIGERDCSIFAGAGDGGSKSRSRYISHAVFFIEGTRLVFEISANAFLWKMVRSIAGTFLHYEERDTPPEQLRDIITSGERGLAGPTLPPHGLFLWKVDYYR